MNYPGRPAGNWCWRFLPGALNDGIIHRLADLTRLYGRCD
jgi:4-alpha-glucanotransferase